MKKILVKIVIFALLVFSIIGFIATNPQLFKGKEVVAEKDEWKKHVESDEQIREDDFYEKYRRLDSETFLEHQVGNIGDEVHYMSAVDGDYEERWIKVESCEIIKEVTDELVEAIDKNTGGVNRSLRAYKEDGLDLSEGKYSILKITFTASDIGYDRPHIRYLSSLFMIHAHNEINMEKEGTLMAADNLGYINRDDYYREDNEYSTAFVFKNSEENYFQMLYLVPDSVIANDKLYIAPYECREYLSKPWFYDNSDFIIELNLNKE